MADFRIRVILDPTQAQKGTKDIDNGLNRLEKKAGRVGTVLSQALGFVGIAAGLRELVRLTDTLTNMENRIRLVTKSTAELNAVTKQLFEIANQTRSSFEATATVYSRTALSVKQLGLSQRETLAFTKSLNQAVILSGASAQEASFALIQLSQGLASGTLRGDELRSVLEQLPFVADVIAKSMGVTRGELRLLGQAGKISAKEVIDAFAEAEGELNTLFANTIPTITQSFAVLKNNLMEYIGDANKATGASKIFAQGIMTLANNLDILFEGIAIVSSVIIGVFVGKALVLAEAAVKSLTVAIMANPLGAFIVVVSAAVLALVAFSDHIKLSSDGLATIGDLGAVVFDRISSAVMNLASAVTEFMDGGLGELGPAFTRVRELAQPLLDIADEFLDGIEFSFGGALQLAGRYADRVVNVWLGAFKAIIAVFKGLPEVLGNTFVRAFNFILEKVEDFISATVALVNELNTFLGADQIAFVGLPRFLADTEKGFGDLGKVAADAFLAGFKDSPIEDLIKELLGAAEQRAVRNKPINIKPAVNLNEPGTASNALPFALREQLRLLEEEQKNLQLANRERGIQNELLKAEERLRSSNVTLNDAQRKLLEDAIRVTQAFREQAEVFDSINGPQEELNTRYTSLVALLDQGAISAQEFNNQLYNLFMQQAELNISMGEGSFADGFILGIENMMESVRNFSAEAGGLFADFFESSTEGFAEATANAIVFGDSFSDAIGNAARSAIADLLAGLIKLGLQFVLNATLGSTLGAAATAAGVAQAATLSAAYSSAAAFASLASFGANAIPAQAGIASTVALTTALSAVPGFADGGSVRGIGGPRSDSIPAMLSNGEFVVNARSAARFRPQLEAMNNPAAYQNGGTVGAPAAPAPQPTGGAQGGNGVRIVNVIDPNMVEDYLTSSSGERTIVNVMERNASSLQQILRNN